MSPTAPSPSPDADERPEAQPLTFSEVLDDLGRRPGAKLSIGEMIDALAERGFGAVMLIIALMNALPLPPGATTVLGSPLLILSAQLALRRDTIWLPAWAMRSEVDRRAFAKAVAKVIKPIRWLERVSRPRLRVMVSDPSEVVVGVVCVLLSIVLVLPIPLGNMAPSLTVAVFSLGLMQRDGVMIVLGWVGVAISVSLLALVWSAVAAVVQGALGWITSVF